MTTKQSLRYGLLIYTHKYMLIPIIDLLQYLFGNIFIYLDIVEIVILIHTKK